MNSNTKSSNTKMMKAKNQMRHLAANLLAALTLGLPLLAHAAIVPDRTRVIYNEGEPSVSVTISNKIPNSRLSRNRGLKMKRASRLPARSWCCRRFSGLSQMTAMCCGL
nr:hypothetical protein [Collimonas arenae]